MGLVIRTLLALQEVDLQIISLTNEKSTLIESTEQKRAEVETRRGEFEERQAQTKRLSVEIKKSEIELGEASDLIRKLESQQALVKTNQEYKALDKEIYEAKARQTRIEDGLLQKMELVEQEKLGTREVREQLDREDAELQQEMRAIEGKVASLDRRLAEQQAKRSEVAAGIEDSLLKRYERIFENRSAPVLVPVVNRTCEGCHLAVTAAVESTLRRHASAIVTCENCSRILYIPEEEPEEAG